MTAASQQLASPAPRASRWERLLIVLGICLPVPLLAATGLTIPLPATVERLAAALVPWVETALVDPNQALVRGSIVLAAGELAIGRSEQTAGGSIVAEPRQPAHAPPTQEDSGSKPTSGPGNGAAPIPTGPGSDTDESSDDPKPDPGAKPDPDEQPGGGEPGPIQGTVDELGETVGTVVGGVEETVDEVLPPVDGVTDVLGGTVTGILPGLGG